MFFFFFLAFFSHPLRAQKGVDIYGDERRGQQGVRLCKRLSKRLSKKLRGDTRSWKWGAEKVLESSKEG